MWLRLRQICLVAEELAPVVADLEAVLAPLRKERQQISDADVEAVLAAGAKKARAISSQTLARVRQAIGIAL